MNLCSKCRIKQFFIRLLSYKDPNAGTFATNWDLPWSLLEKAKIFFLLITQSQITGII